MMMKRIMKSSLLVLLIGLSGCGQVGQASDNQKESISQEVAKTETVNAKENTQEEVKGAEKTEGKIEEKPEVKELTLEDKVDAYVENMTLEEKIGQLFMVAFRQDEEGVAITGVNEKIQADLISYPVGGVILFKENIENKQQVTTFIQQLQDLSEIPLWIGVDEEGGMVSRVGSNSQIVEVPFKSAGDIGKIEDVQAAYKEAIRMGEVLAGLGFNMNFAPVADIYNNPSNTVIGTRSFGETAEEVTDRVIYFAKGLREMGVMPVIKHFPGHGNTLQDSHNELAYVEKTLEELEKEELVPFKVALEQGVEAMMIGHLVVKEVDGEKPASLSKKWGDYIKEHFNAEQVLLITDALNMGAITNGLTTTEIVRQSFLAGYDILLMPDNIEEAFKSLIEAYQTREITDERLDESVKKIIIKKITHNLLSVE